MAKQKQVTDGLSPLGMLIELDKMASRLSQSDRTSSLEKEALQESIVCAIRCLSNVLARKSNFDGYDYLRTRKG